MRILLMRYMQILFDNQFSSKHQFLNNQIKIKWQHMRLPTWFLCHAGCQSIWWSVWCCVFEGSLTIVLIFHVAVTAVQASIEWHKYNKKYTVNLGYNEGKGISYFTSFQWKKEWASSHTPRSNIAWECISDRQSDKKGI